MTARKISGRLFLSFKLGIVKIDYEVFFYHSSDFEFPPLIGTSYYELEN